MPELDPFIGRVGWPSERQGAARLLALRRLNRNAVRDNRGLVVARIDLDLDRVDSDEVGRGHVEQNEGRYFPGRAIARGRNVGRNNL